MAVAATVAVVAGVALATTSIVLNRAIDEQLLDQASVAAQTVESAGFDDSLLQGLNFGLPAQVVEANGVVRHPRYPAVGRLPVDDGDFMIAHGNAEPRLRSVDIGGKRYRMATVAVMDRDLRFVQGRELALQLARPMSDVQATLRDLGVVLLAVGIVGIVGSVLLGRLVARAALKPVDAIAVAAEHVARSQDLSALIPVTGRDEITRLADSLNSMLRALGASRARQRQLVDDASHELRTPLTSLRTNIELLMRAEANPHRTLPAADREALLRDVDGQIQELSGLVNELVELARDEAASEDVERLDLAEVVQAAAERARRRANAKGIRIEVDAVPSIVEGRPQTLERAVMNLLDNAVKFSPPSSTVTVRTAGGEVVVMDQGPGIPPEDRPQVFDRFYRAASARGLPGSGLGLAIVADAVADHRGTVDVSTAPGGGVLLRMRLPLAGGGYRPPARSRWSSWALPQPAATTPTTPTTPAIPTIPTNGAAPMNSATQASGATSTSGASPTNGAAPAGVTAPMNGAAPATSDRQ